MSSVLRIPVTAAASRAAVRRSSILPDQGSREAVRRRGGVRHRERARYSLGAVLHREHARQAREEQWETARIREVVRSREAARHRRDPVCPETEKYPETARPVQTDRHRAAPQAREDRQESVRFARRNQDRAAPQAKEGHPETACHVQTNLWAAALSVKENRAVRRRAREAAVIRDRAELSEENEENPAGTI